MLTNSVALPPAPTFLASFPCVPHTPPPTSLRPPPSHRRRRLPHHLSLRGGGSHNGDPDPDDRPYLFDDDCGEDDDEEDDDEIDSDLDASDVDSDASSSLPAPRWRHDVWQDSPDYSMFAASIFADVGCLLAQHGRRREAVPALCFALATARADWHARPRLLSALGCVLRELPDMLPSAITVLQAAARERPADPNSWWNLGTACYQAGRQEEAAQAYTQVCRGEGGRCRCGRRRGHPSSHSS